jgi:hypothetical protein
VYQRAHCLTSRWHWLQPTAFMATLALLHVCIPALFIREVLVLTLPLWKVFTMLKTCITLGGIEARNPHILQVGSQSLPAVC